MTKENPNKLIQLTSPFHLKRSSHIHLMAMNTSLPGCHNKTVKSPKVRRQFQISALRVFFSKALQALKKSPDDCDKTFFNTTIFHRFHVHPFNLFPPQIYDIFDSESLIKTLLFRFPNENHSLGTFNEQNNTDAEKKE